MISAKIIIPKTYYNVGQGQNVNIDNETLTQLEHTLIFAFGGFTRYEVYGGWKAENQDYLYDHSYLYEIFNDSAQTLETFKNSLANIKTNYEHILNQREIYVKLFETAEVS